MVELRRIQMTRGGTFFVTLEKDWATKNGIKRGSIVTTEIASNGRLIINPYYNLERTALTSIIARPDRFSVVGNPKLRNKNRKVYESSFVKCGV